MNVEEIASEIAIDELPGELKSIAEIVGIENAIKLAISFRGCSLYIRSLDQLFRKKRNNKIRNEYDNGESVLFLARKYRLSTRSVEIILGSSD
ncbi:Mor transcription activator family protein [Desulfofustis glycolicus]|uniref:Mor transcription activator family protein n=1 Tax=Desulfofustis glycolicus DSM 9705 TaxID=1121409 RepID=A0A1M5RUN6_9BACT|nr:Mor transcription activator family protein [Desulfofustis glycolicus]SHH29946.1 Mor transcription activator family protein [Desulfofustis glycolicus DSM 9705]